MGNFIYEDDVQGLLQRGHISSVELHFIYYKVQNDPSFIIHESTRNP